jgi:G3E family GTPase
VTGAAFDVIPVNVLTGFLGSGKTTLLQRLLTSDLSTETAVLINEFGEVGIDHLLVGEIAPDAVLLKSGCVCCSIRSELKDAFVRLFSRRQTGEMPPFRRVMVETTGLADPAPIAATLLADSVLRHHFKLGLIVTVVDCVNADLQRQVHPVWTAQVAAADRLIISKADLGGAERCAQLRGRLAEINPAAPIALANDIGSGDDLLLGAGLQGLAPEAEVKRWVGLPRRRALQILGDEETCTARLHPEQNAHDNVTSFCLIFETQIDWIGFGLWLSMLLNRHGANILRVKGILNIAQASYPIAIHGVQHLVHPPVHLREWPDDDRRSRIVFIVRGLDQQQIERSFAVFSGGW